MTSCHSVFTSFFPALIFLVLSFSVSVPPEDQEGQLSTEEEEAKRIAEMGKPILGEHSRLEVVIEESYEFKVMSQITFIKPQCLVLLHESICTINLR